MKEYDIICKLDIEIIWLEVSPSKHVGVIRRHCAEKLRCASMNYMRKNEKKIMKEILKEVT